MVNPEEFMKEYGEYVVTSFGRPYPLVIVEGRDVHLTDMNGKRYLDFWAGIATVNAGHNNPSIQEAAKAQLDRLVHCASQAYYTVPPLELAKKLTAMSPIKPSRVTFHTSGSEANDVALKLIRRHTGRHEVLTLQGSYHGHTYGSRSLSTPVAGYSKAYEMGPYVPGIVHVPAPYCYRCSLGLSHPECGLQCAKMIEDIINFGTSRDVAAFMAEPIMGVGGIVTPPDGYFREVKKIVDGHGAKLILDEVQTGLGRTGEMWGSDSYDVKPDMITLAKALGNGWPISAVLASKPISDSFEPGDHFSTWGASPVMCAAASATLDYIKENRLQENAAKTGKLLLRRLKEMEERYEIVGEARGKGLMIGVEIVKSKASKEPAVEECRKIRSVCSDRGLIIGSGGFWSNVIRIQPPLTINEGHVEEGASIFEEAVKVAS